MIANDWPIEIDPREALAHQRAGALLLDVRSELEQEAGAPAGAIALGLDELPASAATLLPEPERETLVLCASGRRSLAAAAWLRRQGYTRVASIRGGFARWQTERLPLAPAPLDAERMERYARQLVMAEVGVDGQRRLAAARVALVGVGGLGAPIALYLAAAGVGHLTLIDDDRVERSNLQRQVIHCEARLGELKVDSARAALAALNPLVAVRALPQRLTRDNAALLLAEHDLLIDGADNFPTRYLLDASCRTLRLPWIYGAVQGFRGEVSAFDPSRADSPCYRCLYPEPPAAEDAPNCSQAGVLGVLPGLVGMLQASEALKFLLGIGRPLVGRLLSWDALGTHFHELALSRDPDCPGCASAAVAATGKAASRE